MTPSPHVRSYRAQVKEKHNRAKGRNGCPQPCCATGPAAYGDAAGPVPPQTTQTHEVILMTASQPSWRPAAAGWRATRRAMAALRAIHDEQVLAWELFWQSSRVAVGRTGPLAWTPSLDGPRLAGIHLPIPGDTSARNTP